MISAAELQRATSLPDLAVLFRKLGYPVNLEPVDAQVYAGSGQPLWLGCRFGNVDLLFTGCEPEQRLRRALIEHSRRNVLRSLVLVSLPDERHVTIDVAARGELKMMSMDRLAVRRDLLDRLNSLDTRGRADIDPAALFARAVDRESLTREFFHRFRDARSLVVQALSRIAPAEGRIECERQALLILSRLLFLYFLQQRGWLDRDHRFLIDRFHDAVREGREFYATVLLPLFFGCLNTPVAQRDESVRSLGNVPYLNGGLFTPSRFELRNSTMLVPNDVLGEVLETTFEPYSFVADESALAPFGIDPEMLGRVFENLMAADERAESGSYYTPKPLVDELTARAIASWCGNDDPRVGRAIEQILANHEADLDDEACASVRERLANITILDPACGSGAFLLSALHQIERLWRHVSGEVPAQLRRRIVERSLFGVDLKPEAVQLCELRLWLAIVVDSASDADLLPLPNLDRNIFQGNSLFAPIDFLVTDRADLYRDWLHALRGRRELIDTYRGAPCSIKRTLGETIRKGDSELAAAFLRRAIDMYESEADDLGRQAAMVRPAASVAPAPHPAIESARQLLAEIERGQLDFFSYEVHLAHVLANGGFDLIVGNPPWVRHSNLDANDRRRLADRYRLFRGDGGGFRQPDLSLAFCEKAENLLRKGGVIAFLLPSKITNAGYAAALRRAIERDCTLEAVFDWSAEAKRLFDADTFPLGLVYRKLRCSDAVIDVRSEDGSFTLPQSSLRRNGAPWILVPDEVHAILRRHEAMLPDLTTALRREPMMGVKTGANRRFFLHDVEFTNGHARLAACDAQIPREAICRTFRGRDIGQGRLTGGDWMLWSPAGRWRGAEWLRRLAECHGVTPDEMELAFVRPEHFGIKVAWKDVSRGFRCVAVPATTNVGVFEFPLIPNQTVYFVDCTSLTEALLISSVLSSTIVNAHALARFQRAKDGHYRYFGCAVATLPFPSLDDERTELLLQAVRRRSHNAIEKIVASLYATSDAELDALATFVSRRMRR